MSKDEYLQHVLESYHPVALTSVLEDETLRGEVFRKHFPSLEDFLRASQQKIAAYVPEPGQSVDAGVKEGLHGRSKR